MWVCVCIYMNVFCIISYFDFPVEVQYAVVVCDISAIFPSTQARCVFLKRLMVFLTSSGKFLISTLSTNILLKKEDKYMETSFI
jgi:hypothetical protein